MSVIGLGIESSCDETSVAIVRDGKELLALTIHSQLADHRPYKGVVPELASRAHLEKINPLLEQALSFAKISLKDLNYIAVTTHPGLVGSLLIGAQAARVLSFVSGVPLVSINHLEAHFAVLGLEYEMPVYPWLGVLLSGGNSSIYLVKGLGEMELLADTLDDSLGEAFDKVSAILGLPYPGGPPIEAQANLYKGGGPNPFPKLLRDDKEDQIRFSYSGLKTAVLYEAQRLGPNIDIPKFCYHFQETAFSLVFRNLEKAINKTGVRTILCGGGVLANGRLREGLNQFAEQKSLAIYYPQKKIYCTDNGAMVACLGYQYWKEKRFVGLDFRISPKRELEIEL